MSTSSSTTGSPSTSSPSSTPSHADSNTASLYLFTFLATILILVLLSASLVLRSYVLRRRYRQRFQQALADGLFADLDNGVGQFDTLGGLGLSTRRLGPKPAVFDTWVRPAGKTDLWSSLTPVALRCSPTLSPPSMSMLSLSGSRSTLHIRPSFLPHFRIPSPFSHSRPCSPLPRQAQPFNRSLSPTLPTSPDPNTFSEKDTTKLAVCVLVAMPDASTQVHRPAPDVKGKRVDPVETHTHQQNAGDPLLPSSLHRSGARISNDDEGLPLLEFGVIEASTGEWIWQA